MIRFRDRQDAGRRLAMRLVGLAEERPIVIALPRGGVVVGYEVSRTLGAPLDVWVVRKVGVPHQPELGLGAVAEGGFVYRSQEVVRQTRVPEAQLARAIVAKRREVEERVARYRGDRPAPVLRGRTVVLVDDGLATGGTARAAIASIRAQNPKKIVLAVPVVSAETVRALTSDVDEVIASVTPNELYAVGFWYDDFRQVPDDEVIRLLARRRAELEGSAHAVA